jgi:hypothetical protein
MVQFARVVALNIAHHVTQRVNARRFILDNRRGAQRLLSRCT